MKKERVIGLFNGEAEKAYVKTWQVLANALTIAQQFRYRPSVQLTNMTNRRITSSTDKHVRCLASQPRKK